MLRSRCITVTPHSTPSTSNRFFEATTRFFLQLILWLWFCGLRLLFNIEHASSFVKCEAFGRERY
ncbi:hypothetical protein ARMGADRAFT_580635 [Armillaria gallica]|uniref:Uncharacterized protein n=1 Tax=Armillaria gallica TaxID=47427 RepID=A0A2H3DXG0_ARMGA|nr:hypothetical protein ARMGADRAFT_580635 [Armillaria gallica]